MQGNDPYLNLTMVWIQLGNGIKGLSHTAAFYNLPNL